MLVVRSAVSGPTITSACCSRRSRPPRGKGCKVISPGPVVTLVEARLPGSVPRKSLARREGRAGPGSTHLTGEYGGVKVPHPSSMVGFTRPENDVGNVWAAGQIGGLFDPVVRVRLPGEKQCALETPPGRKVFTGKFCVRHLGVLWPGQEVIIKSMSTLSL